MQCESVRLLLYRVADGRLLDDDAEAVRTHLEACSGCGQRYQQIVKLDEWMMDAEAELPPGRLRERLLAAYRQRMAGRPCGAGLQPVHGLFARTKASGWRRLLSLRRAAVIGLVAILSSGTTWTVLRDDAKGHVASSPTAAPPRMPLDHIFPLILRDSYTTVHADGHRESGSWIRIVQ